MSKVEDMSVWEFNWRVPMGVRRLLRIKKIEKLFMYGRND